MHGSGRGQCDAVVRKFWPTPLGALDHPWPTGDARSAMMSSCSCSHPPSAGCLSPHGVTGHVSLAQWHFPGGNFASQGTLGNVWIFLAVTTAGIPLTCSKWGPGRLLNMP